MSSSPPTYVPATGLSLLGVYGLPILQALITAVGIIYAVYAFRNRQKRIVQPVYTTRRSNGKSSEKNSARNSDASTKNASRSSDIQQAANKNKDFASIKEMEVESQVRAAPAPAAPEPPTPVSMETKPESTKSLFSDETLPISPLSDAQLSSTDSAGATPVFSSKLRIKGVASRVSLVRPTSTRGSLARLRIRPAIKRSKPSNRLSSNRLSSRVRAADKRRRLSQSTGVKDKQVTNTSLNCPRPAEGDVSSASISPDCRRWSESKLQPMKSSLPQSMVSYLPRHLLKSPLEIMAGNRNISFRSLNDLERQLLRRRRNADQTAAANLLSDWQAPTNNERNPSFLLPPLNTTHKLGNKETFM